MSNLSTPTENIVFPEPSGYNPTRNNKSGVTPVPDEFTEDDLQLFERKVRSKQAEMISQSSNLMADYSQQVATISSNSARDLQIVADLRAQTGQQPPLWFTSFERRLDTKLRGIDTRFNGIDTRFNGIDTRFNGIDTRFNRLDTRLNRLETTLNRMDTTVNGLRYLVMKSENEKKRRFHETVEPIPFLDGSNPPDNLAAIGCVDDIQRMSKQDVLAYLHGYGIGCTNSESAVDLKVKLRAAVGLISPPDLAVVFTPSGRTRGG